MRILTALIGSERGAQARVARESGISAPQLSRYLNGVFSMSVAELEAICRVLGQEPYRLLEIARDGRADSEASEAEAQRVVASDLEEDLARARLAVLPEVEATPDDDDVA